ncbi:MAG: type II secretion system protein [Candidatus Riflebacteria bacterium]|nr:type II secretion system protein [Candidatus Riflebacteria bacterium]
MNKCAGFSLVEILVAVGILAASMLPIALSFSSGNRGIQMTSDEFSAHSAAMELMEQMMSAPFRLLPVGTFKDANIVDGVPLGGGSPLRLHISAIPDLSRELVISEVKKGAMVRFKKVEVTVSWASKEPGPRRSFSLKSLLANES